MLQTWHLNGMLAATSLCTSQVAPMLIPVLIVLAFVLLLLGVVFLGTVLSLLSQLVIGLVIGGIARLVLPGPHAIGWFATSLCGIVGSLGGGLLAHHLFGTHGFKETVLSVLCAAGLIYALDRAG